MYVSKSFLSRNLNYALELLHMVLNSFTKSVTIELNIFFEYVMVLKETGVQWNYPS